MGSIRVLDVTDVAAFGRIPPCADPGFDHRSCDYWEDADRGSKAARLAWLEPSAAGAAKGAGATAARQRPANPFLADLEAAAPAANPFKTERPANSFFAPGDDGDDDDAEMAANPAANPFAPRPASNLPTSSRLDPRRQNQ